MLGVGYLTHAWEIILCTYERIGARNVQEMVLAGIPTHTQQGVLGTYECIIAMNWRVHVRVEIPNTCYG